MSRFAIVVLTALLFGCANPINQRTAADYYQAGEAALAKGDIPHAKEMFTRALINARLGHMGDRTEARILSKLGRVYGNLCDHANAENALLEARDLNIKVFEKNPVLTFPSRIELAQFSYDIGNYDKAVRYYEEAIEVAGVKRIKEFDAATYYEVMKDYADALSKVGKTDQAKLVLSEVKASDSSYSGSANSGYIRYSKTCN